MIIKALALGVTNLRAGSMLVIIILAIFIIVLTLSERTEQKIRTEFAT